MAHLVDSKAVHQRPVCNNLIRFVVEKEVEINFNEAKKTRDLTSKPKATTHFCFNSKKSTLPATPAPIQTHLPWISPQGRMVASAQEEGSGQGEATSLPSKESDSGKSYKATQEDATISQGDIEIAVRVAQASETFMG